MCPICFLTGRTIVAGTGSAVGLGHGIAKLTQQIGELNPSPRRHDTAIPALDSEALSLRLDRCLPSIGKPVIRSNAEFSA